MLHGYLVVLHLHEGPELRTHCWLDREEKKKDQHPSGLEPTTSRVLLRRCVCWRCATTTAHYLTIFFIRPDCHLTNDPNLPVWVLMERDPLEVPAIGIRFSFRRLFRPRVSLSLERSLLNRGLINTTDMSDWQARKPFYDNGIYHSQSRPHFCKPTEYKLFFNKLSLSPSLW